MRAEREADKRAEEQEREQKSERARSAREADKRAQERERSQRLEEVRSSASAFAAYLAALQSFHHGAFDLDKALAAYEQRAEERTYWKVDFIDSAFRETFEAKTFDEVLEETPWVGMSYENGPGYQRERSVLRWGTRIGALAGMVAGWRAGWVAGSGTLAMATTLVVVLTSHLRRRWHQEFLQQEQRNLDAFKAGVDSRRQELAQRKAVHDFAEAEGLARWQQRHLEHEAREAERRRNYEIQEQTNRVLFEANEESRQDVLIDAREGARGAIAILCEAGLPLSITLSPPAEANVGPFEGYEAGYFVASSREIHILIRLPDADVVPEQIVEATAAGNKLRSKNMPASQSAQIHARMVASLALAHIKQILVFYPFAEVVLVECVRAEPDSATGIDRDQVHLSVICHRDDFVQLQLDRIDPFVTVESWGGHQIGAGPRAAIRAKINPATIVWSTVDDDGVLVPYGVRPEEKNRINPNPFALRTS